MKEKLLEIISDPTTRGIIIGSFFTLLGILIQGLISWMLESLRHRWSFNAETCRFERESKERECKESRDYKIEWQKKREKAYLDFACFYNRVLMGAQLEAQKTGKMEVVHPNLSSNSKSSLELVTSLGIMSDVNSTLRLYGSNEVCIAASNFYIGLLKCEQSGRMTCEQIVSSIAELNAVVALMNREGLNLGLTKNELVGDAME